jgi:uncharacterized membrane protein (UPF0182 family)
VFPDLFRSLADMPEDIRGRLRYPEGIFRVQAGMHGTYHMTNPAVFYNKEDQWDIPSIGTEPRAEPMQPYYTIMKLPGEAAPEFIQMLPFTPARKDNLASWMVARSDGVHYGRMLVFQFPKQKVVFGPRQIVGRINQDQAIAPQITLWNQQRLRGPPRNAARDSNRGVAHLHTAAVPALCRRPHSRAEARDCCASEPDRDGRNTGERLGSPLSFWCTR